MLLLVCPVSYSLFLFRSVSLNQNCLPFVGAIEIAASVHRIHKGMLPFDASHCLDAGFEAGIAWNALQSECLSLGGVSAQQSSELRCRGGTPIEGVHCGQQSLRRVVFCMQDTLVCSCM